MIQLISEVQDAMNKILAEKYGIQCNIFSLRWDPDRADNLLLTDNEWMFFHSIRSRSSYVNIGSALPLDNDWLMQATI
jgi:hypothetical protein